MDNDLVKKALHKKKEGSKKGSGKSKESKVKTATCKEPEALINSNDGSILKICSNSNVAEWKSLALLGKVALTDHGNKY